MPALHLRGLQAFEATGRCGTVTLAARELGVSPGAISQHIRNLEDMLGVLLLERKGRHVALTSWGKLYHDEISKGFSQLEKASDVLERARTESSITLSALTSVANRWIGPKVFEWQTQFRGAKVRLYGQDHEPRLGAEAADFRITYGKRARQHEHYVELYTDWVVPVCSPKLLERQLIEQPADIFKLPLFSIDWENDFLPPPGWDDWARQCGIRDIRHSEICSFSLSSSAIGAALSAQGCVLAQLSMIGDELTDGRLVIPFDIRLPLAESYYLAWDRAALNKPFGVPFQRWIIQLAKKQELFSKPQPLN